MFFSLDIVNKIFQKINKDIEKRKENPQLRNNELSRLSLYEISTRRNSTNSTASANSGLGNNPIITPTNLNRKNSTNLTTSTNSRSLLNPSMLHSNNVI